MKRVSKKDLLCMIETQGEIISNLNNSRIESESRIYEFVDNQLKGIGGTLAFMEVYPERSMFKSILSPSNKRYGPFSNVLGVHGKGTGLRNEIDALKEKLDAVMKHIGLKYESAEEIRAKCVKKAEAKVTRVRKKK